MQSPRRRGIVAAAIVVALVAAGALVAIKWGGDTETTAVPTVESSVADTFPTSLETTLTSVEAATTGATSSTSTEVAPPTTASSGPANALFPLKPGFQSVRQGFVNKGSRRLSHRLVFTVTDVSKEIGGVRTVLAIDQDFDGGELAEQSLEFFSVADTGDIRYLGSYTETYEGGQFVNATDAWLDGVKGGRAGTLVPGSPKAGSPSFTQAVVPGEGAATAKVVRIGERKCVPYKCFNDVVVLEEDGSEHKYFAPGVGGILTEPLSGDPQETEELINVTQLSPQGLAEISAEGLKLDGHARTVAPDVYGSSAPAKRAS